MEDLSQKIYNEFFIKGIDYKSLFEIHPQRAYYDLKCEHGVFTFLKNEDWEFFGVKKTSYPFENEKIIEVTELLISISDEKETITIKKIGAFLKNINKQQDFFNSI
jgi:hypothetical protein